MGIRDWSREVACGVYCGEAFPTKSYRAGGMVELRKIAECQEGRT